MNLEYFGRQRKLLGKVGALCNVEREIVPKQSDSCMWKRLIWIRNLFSNQIRRQFGNGQGTYFWKDPWHPWGILIQQAPEMKRKLNIELDAKVSQVLQGSQWNLPFGRGRGWDQQVHTPDLQNH